MRPKIADNLTLLLEIGEAATAGEDLTGLFDKILDVILISLQVETASLMLQEEDGCLHIRAARGLPPEVVRETRIAPGEGISGHILTSGKPVLVEDLALDGRFPSSGGGHRYRNRSLLSVPIRCHGRILGVIHVNNKRSGEVFTPADQDLLTAMAHHAALAVENFQLVADLRRRTRELENANRDLHRLHLGRSRLVCNLSHELNTPLTSILGYLELVLNSPDDVQVGTLRQHLENVYDQGRRMEGLITGMLRLFSLDAGEEAWEMTVFPLSEVVRKSLESRGEEIARKGLRVQSEIADGLPVIYADREKTGMLVDALIDNAIKFNRPGGCLAIRAKGPAENGFGCIHLQVHNDGSAIPSEADGEIFGGFHQLGDLHTQKPPGLGVGLATCRVIAERMNGKIFLEPSEGEGTTFGVLLPIAEGVDGR